MRETGCCRCQSLPSCICQQSTHFPNNFCCLYSLFLLSRFQSQIVKIVLLISSARAADTVVFGKARCSHSRRPLVFRYVRLLHWLVFHAVLAKLGQCYAVVFTLRSRVCCLLTLAVGWQLADSLSHNTKTAIVSLNREAVVIKAQNHYRKWNRALWREYCRADLARYGL